MNQIGRSIEVLERMVEILVDVGSLVYFYSLKLL